MTRAILSILGNWPGPQAWRRLHRATRQEILELAEQGELHPDERIAAIAVEWAKWRRALSPWRQLGIALAVLLAMQAAVGLLFLLLTLIPGSETSHGRSLLGWVQIVGWLVLAIGRLVIGPSSAAHEILRMDGLGGRAGGE
jgi:hypothetical protein